MTQNGRKSSERLHVSDFFGIFRRAFSEFLFVPTLIIAGFLLLAPATYLLDSVELGWLKPIRDFLRARVFANSQATSGLLETIAGGIIALTSITISLLLIAVQQSAGSMTAQVFDQFLRRRLNQTYFGVFIGLALFALITLATVNEPFNPVFGATVAFLGTVTALYLLLLLLYTTINQMRPEEIIEAIHRHILAARGRELDILAGTRRSPIGRGTYALPITMQRHGFMTHIDVDRIAASANKLGGEVVFEAAIGTYIAFEDVIATAHADSFEDAAAIGREVSLAVVIERQRDITFDPVYGIEQIENIAWTSISTSKSNPAPGLLAIQCLRDIMSRWSAEERRESADERAPVVYTRDAFASLFNALETFAVVSSESMQFQNYAEILHTLSNSFARLPSEWQSRAEDLILRMITVLADFPLTTELEKALTQLEAALRKAARNETADALQQARVKLAGSIGKLGSRATRR